MERFWGLVEYKPQWTLTLRGWLIAFLVAAAMLLLAIARIHSFLAFSKPIKADALVVEGWLGDDALKGAIVEFERRGYKILVTTGSPLSRGFYLSEYKNSAELASASLAALGFDASQIATVPSPKVKRNRTAAAAVAVRAWLATTDSAIKSINLYSSNVHSRRSWLVFKQVLGPEINVGVISHPTADYEPNSWWTTSAGVRSVISETIAFFYSRLTNWSI